MKRLIAALIVVHRYLGLVFCLIFLIWFASGIVMVYKRMPEFSAEERLARLPPLDAAAVKLSPARAFEAAGLQGAPQRVLLTSFQSRPVYRFAFEAGSLTVFADDGSYVESVERDDAVAIAAAMFPENAATTRYLDSREARPVDDYEPVQIHRGAASDRARRCCRPGLRGGGHRRSRDEDRPIESLLGLCRTCDALVLLHAAARHARRSGTT